MICPLYKAAGTTYMAPSRPAWRLHHVDSTLLGSLFFSFADVRRIMVIG